MAKKRNGNTKKRIKIGYAKNGRKQERNDMAL